MLAVTSDQPQMRLPAGAPKVGWSVLFTIVAATLQGAGHARFEFAFCGLLAPALFLIAVDGCDPRRGTVLGALFGAIVALSFAPQAGAPWMAATGVFCFALLCGTQGALLAWALAADRPSHGLKGVSICARSPVRVGNHARCGNQTLYVCGGEL